MRPYRLHYISDIEGWAYWWVGLALREYAPAHVTVTVGCHDRAVQEAAGADVVFDMVYQGVPDFAPALERVSSRSILVSGFNVGFELGANTMLPTLARHSNHVIVNSRDCWREAVRRGLLMPERSSFVSIGVDGQKFNVRTPLGARPPKLKFCCSQGHAEWKGANILRAMEPDFHSAGFKTDFVVVDSHGSQRMDQQQLADWYQDGFAYLCLSKPGHDGTPMPALESAASGCVLIATETGNMPELIIDRHNGIILKDREPASILEAVKYAREHRDRLTTNMRESIQGWLWERRAADYFRVFDGLVNRTI